MSFVLFVALASVMTLAWFSIVKILPSCATSHLRYKLWAMRDLTLDESRAGAYENGEQVRRFVRDLETAIRVAPDLSVLNLIAFQRMARGVPPPKVEPFDVEKLTPADREQLEPRFREYQWLLVRNAFVGSPSGWLAIFVISLSGLARVVLSRHLSLLRPFLRQEAEKIPAEPALAYLSNLRRDRQLSACM